MEGCLACDLTGGRIDLPGGRIHATAHWVVEHCIGPFGVGALIVKPLRHCLHVSDLSADESAELGPLLQRATGVIQDLAGADQVYVCLWSHLGWRPGHIHFVLQPSWDRLGDRYEKPGPMLQVEMLSANVTPAPAEVEAFCDRARAAFHALEAPV